MKTTLNLKGIQLGNLKIGDITLEQEYSATEAINLVFAGKKFVKELIKDLPEMLLDLEGAYETFQEIDERQSANEPSMEEILANLRAERDAEYAREAEKKAKASEKLVADRPMPKVKVNVIGPKGMDMPDEVKGIISHIINDIENGRIR